MGLDNGPDSGPESGFYKKERERSERSRKDVQRHVQRVKEPEMCLDIGPDSGPDSGTALTGSRKLGAKRILGSDV